MKAYDLVVLGGGTAGMTAAIGAAGFGARTLLVERSRTGGGCLWTGCVPSKALLTVAARAQDARTAAGLGLHIPEVHVDFAAVMAHVKQAMATIEPHDSPEMLRDEGVEVWTDSPAVRVDEAAVGRQLVVERDGREHRLGFDRLLVALGRRPNVEDIGLQEAGIDLDEHGAVAVDDRLRTSNKRVYAGGDVTMRLPFTHTAATHGGRVVQNALFNLRQSVDHERIPWVAFTDPEVARIGLSVAEARERFGAKTRVRTSHHVDLDRAVTADETGGFATLVGDPKGRIVGATIVGPRAGETIGEVVAWMAGKAKLSTIVYATHAYPTWNGDLVAASLEEMRASFGRVKWLTHALIWARRRLWQPNAKTTVRCDHGDRSTIRP